MIVFQVIRGHWIFSVDAGFRLSGSCFSATNKVRLLPGRLR
jgi:hypothetical protein